MPEIALGLMAGRLHHTPRPKWRAKRLFADIQPEPFDGWGISGEYSLHRALIMTLFQACLM